MLCGILFVHVTFQIYVVILILNVVLTWLGVLGVLRLSGLSHLGASVIVL